MLTMHILMGNHPHALPLKRNEIGSPRVGLDFADEPVPHEAFKPFVRELKFDCGELAIVTFLQAVTYGKPLVLLPVVISSRFHHGSISYNAARGYLVPENLKGGSVAVRTYAQTTGVWVRGILRHEYGVDDSSVNWVTFDDSHLAEYHDPANCRRAAAGNHPEQMLLDGEVTAAIPISLASTALRRPELKPLIHDPESAAQDWYRRYGAIPINHMLVVRKSLVETQPEAVKELYRLFVAGKRTLPTPAAGDFDMLPTGIQAVRSGLELVIQYAVEQRIIPRRFEVNELFAPVVDLLGSEA